MTRTVYIAHIFDYEFEGRMYGVFDAETDEKVVKGWFHPHSAAVRAAEKRGFVVQVDAPADGTLSPEISGDGSGEALPVLDLGGAW